MTANLATIVFFAVILMTSLGALAGYCLKRAATAQCFDDIWRHPWLYGGGILYLIAAVLNVSVLQHLQYSVVLPLTSLTYVWTLIISRLLLHEAVTVRKMIGTILILSGAVSIGL